MINLITWLAKGRRASPSVSHALGNIAIWASQDPIGRKHDAAGIAETAGCRAQGAHPAQTRRKGDQCSACKLAESCIDFQNFRLRDVETTVLGSYSIANSV